MPIHFENEIRLGKAGVFLTKASCVPLSLLTSPVVSGTESVGSTLTCSDGTYNGSTPITYSYSWRSTLDPSTTIGTNSTYVILSADIGYQLSCIVTASNCGGSLSTQSNQTGIIPAPVSYLFDVFAASGVTPYAAFSLRKVNSAYTGACIRIRRPSDNAELDIGFVSDVVDTAAIISFASGTIAHVVIVYDQSGNNRQRYTGIAVRQPHIMTAANVIYTQNGRTAIRFNNTNHALQQNSFWQILGSDSSSFMVYRNTQSGESILYWGNSGSYTHVTQSGNFGTAYGGATSSLNKVNSVTQTISTRAQAYTQLANKPTSIVHYTDINLANPTFNAFNFGGYGLTGFGFVWEGYYQEEIYCSGAQVANATLSAAVYSDQAAFYNLPTDTDAIAFINRVNAAGGTLSYTEMMAVNQLVIDLKAAGLWTSMKAIYPMVGASAAACAQNLVSSSFTGTFTSGWTFASTGVTPNGTSAYMDTGFNPTGNLSVNSQCYGYYSRSNTAAGSKREMGGYNSLGGGNEDVGLLAKFTGDLFYSIIGGTTFPSVSNTDSNLVSLLFLLVLTKTLSNGQ
jgi:hypothetical protein